MAFVLFFMALGYANNLIYIFVFFMISVAFTGMLITNRNVDIVTLLPEQLRPQALFVGVAGTVSVPLKNRATVKAFEIQVLFEKSKDITSKQIVEQLSEVEVEALFFPQRRGLIQLPRLVVQSTYPFGLLRAWRVYRVEQKVLVFPEKRGDQKFPSDSLGEQVLQNAGLFRDHRVFQSSDSVNRIDWRASSRHQELLVKNFEEPERPQLRFDWDQTQNLPTFEARLSQLALWVDEAEKRQHSYSLNLGSKHFPIDHGKAQWFRCLEALALCSEKDLA